MKKFLIICCILVLILAVLAVALWMALPSMGTHLLGRAIGGSVQASRFERGYRQGTLFFDLGNVTLKGGIEGTIKDWRLQLNPWKGLYITYVSISDFELTIKDSGGKVSIVPIPVQLAQFTRGSITYKGQKFIIREIKVKNFNTGGTSEFELDGGAEGLGNLKTKGGGFFKDKQSDIQGELSYSQLDMSRILRGYEGFLSGSGNFTYKDERLTCFISVEGFDFAMRENFLRKPLRVAHDTAKAEVVLELSGMKASVHLEDLSFKGVPVDLKFSVVGNVLATVELRTGFLAVSDVKEYIDLVPLAKRGADILDLLTTGRIMVKQLTFTEPSPFLAELHLADVSASYGKTEVHDIDATVSLTDDRIIVSNAKGSFERSSFYDVSGNIPFAPHKEIEGKGRFSVDAKDLASLLEPEGVRMTAGTADGQAEVKGKEDKGLMVAGTGTLRDAEIIWRGLALKASGSYRFHDREVVFEPLVVSRGTTQVTVKGSVQKDVTRFDLNGTMGAAEIKALLDLQYPLNGVVAAAGELVKEHETFFARGALSLKDLSVEVPGLLKKERGVESSATIELRWDQGVIHINRLTCAVADASLQASGDVTKDRVVGLKMALDVPRLETISRLLFASRIQAAGNLKLDTSVSELRMPIRELPP